MSACLNFSGRMCLQQAMDGRMGGSKSYFIDDFFPLLGIWTYFGVMVCFYLTQLLCASNKLPVDIESNIAHLIGSEFCLSTKSCITCCL